MLCAFGNTVRVRVSDDLASLGTTGKRRRVRAYNSLKRTVFAPVGNDLIRRELLLGAAEHRPSPTHPLLPSAEYISALVT